MPTVVVTDYTFPDLETETAILAPLNCEVIGAQCRSRDELIALTREADHIITQFAPVDAAVIAAMSRARIIVRYGIGVDNVDLQAARERRIPVCNIPDYCIDEVADHTLAFILAANRQVVPHCIGVRSGQWKLATPLAQIRTLRDLTVGVVGFGRIGREVVRRLIPFKCRVLVHDPVAPKADIEGLGGTAADLAKVTAESDLLTLHCPSIPDTRGMVNQAFLSGMKPGAVLINLARGDLVQTGALIEALQSGKLSGAALDVCAPEPIPVDSPLLKMPQVIVAPHIASTSERAVRTLRQTAAQLVARRVRGEPLVNVVNGVTE